MTVTCDQPLDTCGVSRLQDTSRGYLAMTTVCQIQILYLLLQPAICRSIDVLSTYNPRLSSLHREGENITPPLNNSCYFFDSTVLGCDRRLVLGKFGSIDLESEWSNTFDPGAYFTEIREVASFSN